MQPDWVGLAEVYDHHLTSADPLWVDCGDASEASVAEVHVHKGLDVGILLKRGYELQYGDYSFSPKAGDVWLGGMWEPHSWRVTSAGARSVIMCFLPEVLEQHIAPGLDLLGPFTVPASERPRVTSPEMRRQVLSLGERMSREIRAMQPGWKTIVRLQLVELLVLLLRDWKPPRSSRRVAAVRSDDLARIVPALALVHASPRARVTPREAAEACRLSLSGFHRVFRRTMGMSYGQFDLRSRLALVAHALVDSDVPILAVAHKAGFVDASHLHRRFVAQYGCTPAEYRRRAMVRQERSSARRSRGRDT